MEESCLLAILFDQNSKHAGQAQRHMHKCTCVTAMAPAPVRPTSLKLAKVNFLTETIILFQLKYLIFKIKKKLIR